MFWENSELLNFSPDRPGARAAGPAGAWTGRKGFGLHTDAPKHVQTTRTTNDLNSKLGSTNLILAR